MTVQDKAEEPTEAEADALHHATATEDDFTLKCSECGFDPIYYIEKLMLLVKQLKALEKEIEKDRVMS